MARGTHGNRQDGTIAGLLNESDEASTAIKRKLGLNSVRSSTVPICFNSFAMAT
jgi:hypothetical protein